MLPASLRFLGEESAQDTPSRRRFAEAAAIAIRNESGATLGVALVGSSGEDEGVFGRDSGETWLGLASDAGVETVQIPFGGVDDYTTLRITNQVLGQFAKFTA